MTDKSQIICQPKNRRAEIKLLHKTFLKISYSKKEISRALLQNHKQPIDKKTDTRNAFLSYIHKTTECISRILKKKHDNIRTIGGWSEKFPTST